jgi:Fe-S-cluster formation regulator IscX/YfhJ
MKITKSQLKKIIKEEIAETLNEVEFGSRDPQLLRFAQAIFKMLYDNRFDDIVYDNGFLPLGDDNDGNYKREENSMRMLAYQLAQLGLKRGMQNMPQTYEDMEVFYQRMIDDMASAKRKPEPEPQQGFSGSYQERSKKAEELYKEYKDQAGQNLLYTDMGEDVVAVQETEAISYLGSLLGKNANPSPADIIDTIEEGWGEGYMEWQIRQDYEQDYD